MNTYQKQDDLRKTVLHVQQNIQLKKMDNYRFLASTITDIHQSTVLCAKDQITVHCLGTTYLYRKRNNEKETP